MFYVEWCTRTNRRSGNMVPVDLLLKLQDRVKCSYRSVFMFKEEDAKSILETHSSRGFKEYEPFSSQVFIDLDNGDKDLPICREFIQDNGLFANIWESGGKGFHIEIPTILQRGFDLPYSHLEWVKTIGISYDESIYRPSSLIRLPGSIHEKTGKRKVLVESYLSDTLLEVPMKASPKIDFSRFSPSDTKTIDHVLIRASHAASADPSPGNRHITLWGLAKDFAEAHVSLSTTQEILDSINRSWSNPKPQEEVVKAVRQAYGLPPSN